MNDALTYEHFIPIIIFVPPSWEPTVIWVGVPREGVPPDDGADIVHAFDYYAWVASWNEPVDSQMDGHRKVTIGGRNYVLCPHIPSPTEGASDPTK
jgi:hypothetical protein